MVGWYGPELWRLAGVGSDMVHRVSPETARRGPLETLQSSQTQRQVMPTGDTVRSVHGVSYARLWNADLLDTIGSQAALALTALVLSVFSLVGLLSS